MARQAEESTSYKVKIHLNNGYRYASTQPLVIDPDRTSGRNKHKHIHWGTVDESNKFHPNKTFLYADLSERRKLIFPNDCDMSEVAAFTSEREAGRPTNGYDDSNKLYGDIWLLEQIAENTGTCKDPYSDLFSCTNKQQNLYTNLFNQPKPRTLFNLTKTYPKATLPAKITSQA